MLAQNGVPALLYSVFKKGDHTKNNFLKSNLIKDIEIFESQMWTSK
jgi:hypothetical protein